jgi:SagB-type dehydrogenase family enzyme
MNIEHKPEDSIRRQPTIELPPAKTSGSVSVEEAIGHRRSVREFAERPISLEELSQLLWSAQGVTDGKRLRAVPSAGATFPLEIIVITGTFGVGNLAAGIYIYLPAEHALRPIRNGDIRLQLTGVAMDQQAINEAPVTLVIAADYERTRSRYRNRTERYVHMEAGHAAQNLYLQATALGLGTAAIGAFDDNGVRDLLVLSGNLQPLYILPVGHPV